MLAIWLASFFAVFVSFLAYLGSKVFRWWGERGARPEIYHNKESKQVELIIARCPALRNTYTPPLVWGWFGQAQTFFYGMVGRFGIAKQSGERITQQLPDQSTLHYDLYLPEALSSDITVLVCPGIANTSEMSYIQSLVKHCLEQGYRVAVMNHMGAVKDDAITAPRIFTYGGTAEFTAMYKDIKERYPKSHLVGVGLSLGGNIVLRFLGEKPSRQNDFLCAVSVCQGYDPTKCMPYFNQLEKFRIFYNWHITRKMKRLVSRHGNHLLDRVTEQKFLIGEGYHCHGDRDCSGYHRNSREEVDFRGLKKAWLMEQFDESYTRRVLGFSSVEELYRWSGCSELMNKISDFPVLLINAKDDPLVDEEIYHIPLNYVENVNGKAIFVVTKYGGHLGFFEEGFLIPNPISWLDRVIVQYIAAADHKIK